jgi:hypothetical protein
MYSVFPGIVVVLFWRRDVELVMLCSTVPGGRREWWYGTGQPWPGRSA